MKNKDLKNKIIEAIASDATSAETKILLTEILGELDQAKTEQDYITLAIRFAELFGILIEITGSG